MQFISGTFFLFLPIVLLLTHATKPKHRYIVLLFSNYIFYGWHNLAAIPILLATTLWTYLGGRILEKSKKRIWYVLFFFVNILSLAVYKYANFVVANCNYGAFLITGRSDVLQLKPVNLVTPIGLSFYIFQSSSYLNDVYRRGMDAEHNFLRYASFVSFFPTILSGPIQRSRDILPQLKSPAEPDSNQMKRGFLLLIWGFCEKILVANRLSLISTAIFNTWDSQDGIHLLAAAVCFSIYIYSDFSSYSDMACGTASMLGFRIQPNFNNPYLAENLSDFWNRWHTSLNTWFVENIYIPLGGNRRGIFRKYINIMTVFMFSGFWHGASWHFIAWGVLNGVLRILGEILAPLRSGIWKALRVNTNCASIKFLRRMLVFAMITFTWVFFALPSCKEAIQVIVQICAVRPVSFSTPALIELAGSAKETIALLFSVAVFIFIQYHRKEEGRFYTAFSRQPVLIQYICIAVFVSACVVVAFANTSAVNTQFIYFQF